MARKACSKCKIEKPLMAFSPAQKRVGKRGQTLAGMCKKCVNAKARQYRRTNPEAYNRYFRKYNKGKGKNAHYKRLYGITKTEYDAMYIAQDGKCKACGRIQTNRPLSVDHNHKTKQVRGLLCLKCNSTLGFCNDSEEILLSLISYLRELAWRV